jgi:hypothetical protein
MQPGFRQKTMVNQNAPNLYCNTYSGCDFHLDIPQLRQVGCVPLGVRQEGHHHFRVVVETTVGKQRLVQLLGRIPSNRRVRVAQRLHDLNHTNDHRNQQVQRTIETDFDHSLLLLFTCNIPHNADSAAFVLRGFLLTAPS